MNFPQVNFVHGQSRLLSPSEGLGNSVNITIETKSYEVLESQTVVTNINLRSAKPSDILLQLLRDQHISHLRWQRDRRRFRLYLYLALEISVTATALGFGHNGFVMDIFYNITYQNVSDPPRDESWSLKAFLLRLVLVGSVKYIDEPKSSNMETEPCSICLDDLVSGGSNSKHGFPTCMTCSHVFHDNCLLEWLERKNTCPLCRSVL